MRAHVIENGVITTTIEVTELDFMPGLIDASVGGKAGDAWDGEKVIPAEPPSLPVPQRITRRQAIQALILRGHDEQVDAYIDAIADPIQRKLVRAEYNDAQDFERQRPLVIEIGAALGLDLDELFTFAASLS